MDPLILLVRAGQAGLRIRADGDRLIIRGPRTAETLAKEILKREAIILPLVRAWNEGKADRALRDEVASLARMAPPTWRATDPEWAEINAAENAIALAFYAQDFSRLYHALREYRWAIFRSWRRHNAAGRPITEDVL